MSGMARELAFDLEGVQEQQKHTEVIQWLQQADAAIQRNDWTKAEDHLKQLLKVDKDNTKAHRMMGEVQGAGGVGRVRASPPTQNPGGRSFP